jgi:hypothetical protein
MSDFVTPLLNATYGIEGQVLSHRFCGSVKELAQQRRLMEQSLRDLRVLHEKALLFGIPTPPRNLVFETPIRASSREEWQWDFRRALQNLEEVCVRMVDRVIALAPGGNARWNGEDKDHAWMVETIRVQEAMVDAWTEERVFLMDARDTLSAFGRGLQTFASHVEVLPAPELPVIDRALASCNENDTVLAAHSVLDDDLANLTTLLGNDKAPKIFAVARDTSQTVEQRQRAIYVLDNRAIGYDGGQWAKLLNVTEQAARKTDWWKMDRKRLSGG